jgi:hypothetical protein
VSTANRPRDIAPICQWDDGSAYTRPLEPGDRVALPHAWGHVVCVEGLGVTVKRDDGTMGLYQRDSVCFVERPGVDL